MDNDCRIIAGAIRKILERGIQVTSSDLDVISSSTDMISFEDICDRLKDPGSSDALFLTDFLLFPDPSARISLEPLLSAVQPGKEHETAVASILGRQSLTVPVRIESCPPGAGILLNPATAAAYVSRLYMANTPDLSIVKALSGFLPEPTAVRVRVGLRCRHGRPQPSGLEILLKYIGVAGSDSDAFLEPFEFLYDTCLEMPAKALPLEWLSRKKQELKHCFLKLGEIEALAGSHGMEFLMMSRIPVPSDSRETIIRRMEMIDRIMTALNYDNSFPDGVSAVIRKPGLS